MKTILIAALFLRPVVGLPNVLFVDGSAQGTQTPAQIEAKKELNEAARAYREGNFAEAQVRSERALAIDPENKKRQTGEKP